MGLTVIEVRDRQALNEFIQLPFRLYHSDPQWVPPLLSEEKKNFDRRIHPFLKKNDAAFFLCYRNGKTVGRIAAIINHEHNRHYGEAMGFFGFFESIDDVEVAHCLFTAAEDWLKLMHMQAIRGPVNYSVNEVAGLLTDGFDEPPFVMMSFNPPYYQELLRQNGFAIVKRFFAYDVTQQTIRLPFPSTVLEKRLQEEGISIRSPDLSRAEAEIEIIRNLFNEAWKDNWGFIPMSREEALFALQQMKSIAKSDLIFIAENQGTPVGFSLSLPDINQALRPLRGRLFPINWIRLLRGLKKINQIRVILMGVLKKYRHKGIDLLFYIKTVENAVRQNYFRAEMSWILEDNIAMNRVLEHIHARNYRTYALFEKDLYSKPSSRYQPIVAANASGRENRGTK